MRRLLCLLLLLSTLPSFALSVDDFIVSADLGVGKGLTTGVTATGDTLKNLIAKKKAIENVILLEKTRVLEETKKRDILLKNMEDIEIKLTAWDNLSKNMDESVSQGILTSATDEIKKIVDDSITIQKQISLLFMDVTNILDAGPFTEETTVQDIQKQYPAIKKIAQNTLKIYEFDIKKAEDARDEYVVQKQQELSQLSRDIEQAQFIQKGQLTDIIKKILLYISIFLGLMLIKYMSGRVLVRFQEDFSRQHKEAMWFIHRWAFRAIFLIAFLVLFSSEFSAFLPFIAIMATAIGFALRDVVYSFIGWFMIGASDGYQEGDVIQVEDFTGKVFRITPLLTTLEEHGIQGVTGKMVSFPNKIIFDKTIKNFSRAHGFTFISLDFLLTHTSDIDHARNILMEILGQQDLTLYYNSRNVLNKLRYTYGYSEADLHPRIDVVVDNKGVILRAKVFTHVETMHTMQTKISEEFCKRITLDDAITLQKV